MPTEARRTIAFVESAAAMGGVQFSTLYLVQALDKSRWRPVVVCPAEGDLSEACASSGIETLVLPFAGWWSTSVRVTQTLRLPNPFAWIRDLFGIVMTARRLRNLLEEMSPELVVSKGLAAHFIAGFAARGLRVPCVWHAQDFISERAFGIYRQIFSAASRWLPQHVIVDGVKIREQLPASIQSRTTVIHNGVDTSVFRPGLGGSKVRDELGIPKDHLVIGHAGRLTPWKGQHYLVEAFAKFAREHSNVTLLLVGAPVFDNNSYERRLQKMAVDLGLSDRVKFGVYRGELQNALAAMDLFAFTSVEKDTSPLALVSAMAAGRPIVAFDIEGVRELAAADESLLMVAVGDADALAESLVSLIKDRQLRSRLAQSARKAAENRFSLTQHVDRIERVLIRACYGSGVSTTDDTKDDQRVVVGASDTANTSAISPIGS